MHTDRDQNSGEPNTGTPDLNGIDQLGYEQARDQLAEVVRALEVGGLSLDDALALWERGERLARRCEEQLAGARERVDAVLSEAKSGENSGEKSGDENNQADGNGTNSATGQRGR